MPTLLQFTRCFARFSTLPIHAPFHTIPGPGQPRTLTPLPSTSKPLRALLALPRRLALGLLRLLLDLRRQLREGALLQHPHGRARLDDRHLFGPHSNRWRINQSINQSNVVVVPTCACASVRKTHLHVLAPRVHHLQQRLDRQLDGLLLAQALRPLLLQVLLSFDAGNPRHTRVSTAYEVGLTATSTHPDTSAPLTKKPGSNEHTHHRPACWRSSARRSPSPSRPSRCRPGPSGRAWRRHPGWPPR